MIKRFGREVWAKARADYLAGDPGNVVAKRYGMHELTVWKKAKEWDTATSVVAGYVRHQMETKYAGDLDRLSNNLMQTWGKLAEWCSGQADHLNPFTAKEIAQVMEKVTKNMRLIRGQSTDNVESHQTTRMEAIILQAQVPESRIQAIAAAGGSPQIAREAVMRAIKSGDTPLPVVIKPSHNAQETQSPSE